MAGKGQSKAATLDGMKLEDRAYDLLAAVLPRSIKEKTEYGAVIWRDGRSGVLGSSKLRKSTNNDGEVDLGLAELNCGCPQGTIPVATYHTHPVSVAGLGGKFSDDDRILADVWQLTAFLGTSTGGFLRYIPPKLPTQMINGRPTQIVQTDDDGKVLPTPPGVTTPLNRKLPTR